VKRTILLLVPALWLLIFVTTQVIRNFGGRGYFPDLKSFSSLLIIVSISLFSTIGIYVIAKKIKHGSIRKLFFLACYFVATFPILLFVVPAIVSLRLDPLVSERTFNNYSTILGYFGSLFLSFTMTPVIFAHIAYVFYARKLPKSEDEGEEGSPNC